jgi:hypothetical protein
MFPGTLSNAVSGVRAVADASSPAPVPVPYAVNGLSPKCTFAVTNALQLRTELNVERVDVSRLAKGYIPNAFLLVDDATHISAPATPFAAPEWDSHIVRALAANAVLVPVDCFLDAARKRRLASLHSALWGRQFFHRATAALAVKRRASLWLLSMRGMVVSVPVSTSDNVALARQCREADLRVEPFRSDGQSVAHFRIAPRSEVQEPRSPSLALEDVEALRALTSGERRSALSELFIGAMAPFRQPPY